MPWKEIGNNAIDIKKKKGEAVVGTFTGHRDINTKIGPQVIWEFADEDGAPFGVYGFTSLNRGLQGMKPETVCRLTYTGTINMATKFGQKDVHQVKIEVESNETEEEVRPSEPIPF